jgi:hypothetical protein
LRRRERRKCSKSRYRKNEFKKVRKVEKKRKGEGVWKSRVGRNV